MCANKNLDSSNTSNDKYVSRQEMEAHIDTQTEIQVHTKEIRQPGNIL